MILYKTKIQVTCIVSLWGQGRSHASALWGHCTAVSGGEQFNKVLC